MTFISIEGCDGSGKTTQAALLQKKLTEKGLEVILTKEPGGSPLGDMIRGILLSHEIEDSMTEFLLLSAARRDHVLEIKRNLNHGKWIITDRFSDSSIAYQGYAKGLELSKINLITKIITEDFMPSLTILLDVGLDVTQERMKKSGKHTSFYDMKGIEFHQKIKRGFLEIAETYPERIVVVKADESVELVAQRVFEVVERRFFS